jgi:hypothetical protein
MSYGSPGESGFEPYSFRRNGCSCQLSYLAADFRIVLW